MTIDKSQRAKANDLNDRRWFVRVLDRTTGEKAWEAALPSTPLSGGLCLDGAGRAIVCLQDGTVLAFHRPK
jgi:hypothetical protein